jgi:hypothetical protein
MGSLASRFACEGTLRIVEVARDCWSCGAARALVACVALAAWLAPVARADSDPNAPAKSEFEWTFRGSGAWGPVDGYVQVPLGGNAGTSSSRRPTLHELGIHDAPSYQLELGFRWDHFVAFGGYDGLDLDSSGTLAQPLVSHGVAFASGSPFKSSIGLNVGHVGAGWRFDFADGRLRLTPKFDVAILDFSYLLDSPGARAARDYRVTAPRLGFDGSWALGHDLSLEIDGVASIPIPHLPQLPSVTANLCWTPIQGPVRVGFFLGTGARWIDFEDSQHPVPNHTHVSNGPVVTGGLNIAF